MSDTNNNQEFPSITEQGRNLIQMIKDSAADALSGNDILVSNDEKERRYDICQACESFDRLRKRCRECGCFMQHKTALSSAKCPIEKW